MTSNHIIMKKCISISIFFLAVALIFTRCEVAYDKPDFSQPAIFNSVEKGTVTVGGETINIGPAKDYETDSKVVFKITVTSDRSLSKFSVSSTSDAISQESRIIKTVPENAIDDSGNVIGKVNNVVIFYEYLIHPLVPAASNVTVTFTVLNDKNNAASSYHTFSVIKKGSTSGNLLNVISLSYLAANSNGIGTQDGLVDGTEGMRPEGQANRSGPYFSFKHGFGLTNDDDVIKMAEDIDFVGYQTRYAGTNPVLANNSYFLVSPSDTTLLYSAYAGAIMGALLLQGNSGTANITYAGLTKLATYKSNVTTTANDFVTAHKAAYAAIGLTLTASSGKLIWTATKPNVGFEPVKIATVSGNLFGVNEVNKNLRKIALMGNTSRLAIEKLKSQNKTPQVVYFKRLDNIDGPGKVTIGDFDLLTHDNEFDTLLAGIEQDGKTFAGPVQLEQVYGFVMSDGKKGLIRTDNTTVFYSGGTSASVPQPNASNWKVHGVIKYQK